MNRNDDIILISEKNKTIDELEYKISNLIQELRCRDGQYKELLNENERLERKLKWSDGNLMDKMMQLNKYRNLVDDLMKVISILIGRTEGNE